MYAQTVSFGSNPDCHVCPTIQALARKYRDTACCRCGQRWTGNHQKARDGVMLAPMDACETCTAIAEDLTPGESVECPSCKTVIGRGTLDSGPSRPRFRNNRSGRLRLLQHCALIAKWDAVANPQAISLPSSGPVEDGNRHVSKLKHDLQEGEIAPQPVHVSGTSRSARIESTDRPEWSEGQRAAIMRGGRLRQRLDALMREGLRETPRVRAEWQHARDDEWRERASNAASRGEESPARMLCPDTIVSDAHRAAAVIEWLVPRARVLLDSLAASERSPIERRISREVARAFVSDEQWARWHPSAPAPLIPPKRRMPPELPEPPVEPPWSWGWILHRRYWRESLPAYLIAVEDHPTALKRFEHGIANYSEEQREYQRRVHRHKIAIEGGEIGAQVAGDELLDLAERRWFREAVRARAAGSR